MLSSVQALSSSLSLTVILSAVQGTEPSVSDCMEVLLSGRMLWFKGTIFVKITKFLKLCRFGKMFQLFYTSTTVSLLSSLVLVPSTALPQHIYHSLLRKEESSHGESIKPGMFLQQDQAPRHCVSRLSKTSHHREWAPKLSSCTRSLNFLLVLTQIYHLHVCILFENSAYKYTDTYVRRPHFNILSYLFLSQS